MGTASTSLETWRVAQQAQCLSQRTINARLSTVSRLAQHLDGGDPMWATADQVSGFLASLNVSRTSVATYHAHLRAWFEWLVRTEQRLDNPMSRVGKPKPHRLIPRPVSDRELAAILDTPMRYRTRAMILLAAFQGLRVHEIAKIRGEDVNIHDRLLYVEGKGGTVDELPLHPLVAAQAAQLPRQGYWFPSQVEPGQPICRQSVTQIISGVFARAGVAPGAHRLRHWYGTSLLKKGANVRVVQELLRHATLQSTQIYTMVTGDEQRAAVEQLGLSA